MAYLEGPSGRYYGTPEGIASLYALSPKSYTSYYLGGSDTPGGPASYVGPVNAAKAPTAYSPQVMALKAGSLDTTLANFASPRIVAQYQSLGAPPIVAPPSWGGAAPPLPHPDASNLSLGPNLGGRDAIIEAGDFAQPQQPAGSPAGGILLLAGGALLLVLLLKRK